MIARFSSETPTPEIPVDATLAMKKTVLLIITLDTKGPEALFLREALERLGVDVLLMDVGIFPSAHCEGDLRRHKVPSPAGPGRSNGLSRRTTRGRRSGP